jgi:hypothetical protein
VPGCTGDGLARAAPRPTLGGLTSRRVLSSLIAAATVSLGPEAPRSHAAEAMGPPRGYAPFVALQLDGGGARDLERHRSGWLGAAAAGVGLYDGSHVWELTAGARGIRGDQRALTVSASRATVETGLGARAGALWDLDRRAAGFGGGVSFSVLNLEGDLVLDGNPTASLSLFVQVPVGLLAYLVLGGRR